MRFIPYLASARAVFPLYQTLIFLVPGNMRHPEYRRNLNSFKGPAARIVKCQARWPPSCV